MASKKKKEARKELLEVLDERAEQLEANLEQPPESYCPDQCEPGAPCELPCASLREQPNGEAVQLKEEPEKATQGRPDVPGARTEGQTYRKMISAVASKPKGVRKYFRIRSRY